MTKRYRETLEEVVAGTPAEAEHDPRGAGAPTRFRWRGRSYEVRRVIGHWREDAGWWRAPDGVPVTVPRTDLWRVEAANGVPDSHGVYELVRAGDTWRLDRVWD